MAGMGHNGGPSLASRAGGWIAVYRSMREHPIVGFHLHVKPADQNKGAMQPGLAWIDLLMECNYEDGTVNNNGRKMTLRRGQVLGATSFLAARWNWTPKTVRCWLDKLEAHGMISFGSDAENATSEGVLEGQNRGESSGTLKGGLHGRSKGRLANVLTVCNYSEYQMGDRSKGQVAGQVEGQVQGRVEGQVEGDSAHIPRARAPAKKEKTQEDSQQQRSTTTPREAAAAPLSMDELSNRMVAECNGAIANPVNSLGLLDLSFPLMWMREGADLELDILPTLRAIGKRDHGKGIASWRYFNKPVMDAVARRKAGLPQGYAGKRADGRPAESLEVSNKRAVEGLERMKRLRGLDSGDEPW